jgi:hypothetical protein
MAKLASTTFLLLKCTTIFALQEPGITTGFLLKFLEHFEINNIMIIKDSAGEKYSDNLGT